MTGDLPDTLGEPRAGHGHEHDELLSYLRGELGRERTVELAEQLAASPSLRDEFAWLRAAAEYLQNEHADATADHAFATLEAAIAQSPAPGSLAYAVKRGWLATLAGTWRRHQPVLQTALVALVVVQTITIGYLATGDDRIGSPSVTGMGASCSDVWVTPRADVGIGSLRGWLQRYGGSIDAGPDAQGRLRITLPNREASTAFVHDAAAQRVAERVVGQCGNGAR